MLLALAPLAACTPRAGERCAHCGMHVRPDSRWRCGATLDGRPVRFDAPRCLFAYRFAGHALRDPWVIEYYGPTERQTPATAVRYVLGSRVRGPMGDDVVPVASESIERFRADHGGARALAHDEVTAAIVNAL